MLPWDWDIDTQVSGSTLTYMAKHHNYTHYDYVSKDDPPVERTYLLDVNPASIERERGNGNNIIDARWIDTRNGLYIDITGLSETHPDDQPGVWSCKNYHRYHTTDLYPMRETMYEGIIAKVPYAYDRILTQEYEEKALVMTDYEGYVWTFLLSRLFGCAFLLTYLIVDIAGTPSSRCGCRNPKKSLPKRGRRRKPRKRKRKQGKQSKSERSMRKRKN